MERIKVLVASQNQIKALAAQDAFKIFLESDITVDLYTENIDSGVADQPTTLEASAEGVVNRLNAIKNTVGYDYYVAIEGGMYNVDTLDGKKWFEAACAGVIKNDKQCVAFGPGYPVPMRFVKHILDGKDLNHAMERETGIKKAGNAGGFNGWLTEDKLDRRKGSAQAVLLAIYGLKYED